MSQIPRRAHPTGVDLVQLLAATLTFGTQIGEKCPPLEESVTRWIHELQEGHQDAAQRLWERYVHRIIVVASKKLGTVPKRIGDKEDIAITVFKNLCEGVMDGRFTKLEDRDDLWQILLMITDRRVKDHIRRFLSRPEVGESALVGAGRSTDGRAVENLSAPEPTPEFAAQAAEAFQRLLDSLTDPNLKRVAILKIQGFTNVEIAERMNCVGKTVSRRLKLIRRRWSEVGVNL